MSKAIVIENARSRGLPSRIPALALALAFTLAPPPALAMRKGTDISKDPYEHAWTFTALLEADDSETGTSTFKCLAVAVSADMLVTAGHCLRGEKKNFRVKFIRQMKPLKYETIPVKSFRFHPSTNAGNDGDMYEEFEDDKAALYHDIGVVMLEGLSKHAVPISLAPPNLKADEASQYRTFIFGRGRDELYRDTGKMEFASLFFMGPATGGNNIWIARMDTDKKGKAVSACVGDSGAPVTIAIEDETTVGRTSHHLLGIYTMHSDQILPENLKKAKKFWGGLSKIPQCGIVIGYTNIQSERVWIERTMNELDPGSARKLHVSGKSW